MANLEAQYRTPRSHVPQLLRLAFSPPWTTIMAMAGQVVLCSLGWALAGVMIVKKIFQFPDSLASLIQKNPSDTNMLITVTSTVLGMSGSTLLGITVKHALTSCLPGGVPLVKMTAWVRLASNSKFLQLRSHPRWTLLSVLWVAVTGFLIPAWSNLLTPVNVVQQFPVNGRELDLLSPALPNFLLTHVSSFPYVNQTTRSYSLTPESLQFLANNTGYFSQAGRSAASFSIDSEYPAFIGQFNSSTGGLSPATPKDQLSDPPTPRENYQGLSTSYTLVQQGFTANISCMASSSRSPTITLNNTASVGHTSENPSGAFNYTLETWSWATNCSGNGQYYTGEVDIVTSNDGSIVNRLFATSVCFYQDFSGPSNQSFLVLMQSPNSSFYSTSYSMPTVCQVTPMVTTVEAQYNGTGLVNVNKVRHQVPLPDDSWPLASIQGLTIWGLYFLTQGLYSNSFADDPFEAMQLINYQFPDGITPVLAPYLRGIFEYGGSVLRASTTQFLSPGGQPLPDDMAIPVNGTMNVQTIGWKFHPRTHGVALAVITLVTMVTAVSGIFALLEANRTLQRGNTCTFDPTNLMDVLVASSKGSLTNELLQRDEQDCENVMVGLAVTDEGKPVLNNYAVATLSEGSPANALSQREGKEGREKLMADRQGSAYVERSDGADDAGKFA